MPLSQTLTLLRVIDDGGQGTLQQHDPLLGTGGVAGQRRGAEGLEALQSRGHGARHALGTRGG